MKRSLGAQPLAAAAPVWVIGSYGQGGRPNLMVVSWGGICCSSPPCLAISVQKSRRTHANILDSEAFTVNVPSRCHLIETDFLGMVSGTNVDKFAVTGLTPVRSTLVAAPYVAEFPLVLECRLRQAVELGSHTQFIGLILDVKADQEVLEKESILKASAVNPLVASSGDRSYYALGPFLERAYAPGWPLADLSQGIRPQMRQARSQS